MCRPHNFLMRAAITSVAGASIAATACVLLHTIHHDAAFAEVHWCFYGSMFRVRDTHQQEMCRQKHFHGGSDHSNENSGPIAASVCVLRRNPSQDPTRRSFHERSSLLLRKHNLQYIRSGRCRRESFLTVAATCAGYH